LGKEVQALRGWYGTWRGSQREEEEDSHLSLEHMQMAIHSSDDDVEVPVPCHVVDQRGAEEVVPEIDPLCAGLPPIKEVEVAVKGRHEKVQPSPALLLLHSLGATSTPAPASDALAALARLV
jgi:hypothetical protein